MIKSRECEDVVKWLKTYPNAITKAHPNAIQISDRVHLLKNLTSYATDYIKKEIKQRITMNSTSIDDKNKDSITEYCLSKTNENRKLTTEEKYQKILILLNEGKNKAYICKEINMNVKTYERLMNMSDEERNKLFKTKLMNKHDEKVLMKIKVVSEVTDLKSIGLSISEIQRTGLSRVSIRIYLDEEYNPVHASYGKKK